MEDKEQKHIRVITRAPLPRALSVKHLIDDADYDELRAGKTVAVSADAAAFFISNNYCEEVTTDAR